MGDYTVVGLDLDGVLKVAAVFEGHPVIVTGIRDYYAPWIHRVDARHARTADEAVRYSRAAFAQWRSPEGPIGTSASVSGVTGASAAQTVTRRWYNPRTWRS